jgi:hypothetical protein
VRTIVNRSRRRAIALSALLGCLLLAGGCGTTTSYVNPDADLPFYERVAILPFTSLATDRLAGEKVSSVFFTELLSTGFAEVVDPGQLAAAMLRTRGGTPATNPWSTVELMRLGDEIGAQGMFLGTIRDFEMVRTGRDAFPLLSLEVRLLDVNTGRVVWSASETRRGGPAFPLFGWREIHTMGELSVRVCRDLLGTLE